MIDDLQHAPHLSARRLPPRLVLVGLLLAIVVAGVIAALETFKISRECGGAFSQGFSAGFDRYHCQLVIRTTQGRSVLVRRYTVANRMQKIILS